MTTTTALITHQGKLPRVVWHPSGRQYAARIGFKLYHRNGRDVRDRGFQLLGKDYAPAMARAIELAADWAWTTKHFKETRRGQKPYLDRVNQFIAERVARAVLADRSDPQRKFVSEYIAFLR